MRTRVLLLLAASVIVTGCEKPERRSRRPAVTETAVAVDSTPIIPEIAHLRVHPDLERPRIDPGRGYVVPNACPGEFCGYGQWELNRLVTLRSAPSRDADSVGFIPFRRIFCADSGLIAIDEVGIIALGKPAPALDFAVYKPPFKAGDTIRVFNYLSEGYWAVQWRDSLTIAYAYWDAGSETGVRVLKRPVTTWWVHATDKAGQFRGWFVADGLHLASDERPRPCR